MNIDEIKNKLFDQQDLSSNEASFVFDIIMNGEMQEIDMASILIALKIKKETTDEIFGAVKIMREKSMKISSPINSIDTCGTGGDMKGTLNISTSSAIVAASAGAVVAKHGNRSISSKSGSADMLEKLGIKILSEKKDLENSLINNNFCFLFAQYHHSAMKHVANVRKKLKTRTIFNLLGPLTNPASTKKQLIGVFNKNLVRVHCEVLKKFGSEHALIVHGEDGLDEISLSGPTFVSELKNQQIVDFIFDPKEYGYEYINNNKILGKDSEYNAKKFIEMIEGQNLPFQKIVELNAGAALYLSGITKNLKDGFELANKVIINKKTKNYFENLINNQ
tara:strand:- start:74 stop:1078 length:1005 start_codon:yes stop_codon:yes gene_type:complete